MSVGVAFLLQWVWSDVSVGVAIILQWVWLLYYNGCGQPYGRGFPIEWVWPAAHDFGCGYLHDCGRG